MIVMLCHLNHTGQEACIPMVPNPPIYYQSEKECNDAAIEKRKELRNTAQENDIFITEIYSTCVVDLSKPSA